MIYLLLDRNLQPEAYLFLQEGMSHKRRICQHIIGLLQNIFNSSEKFDLSITMHSQYPQVSLLYPCIVFQASLHLSRCSLGAQEVAAE